MTAQPSEREARAREALVNAIEGAIDWQDAEDLAFLTPQDAVAAIAAMLAFANRERADEREAEKERCARVAEQSGNEIDTDSHAESGRLIAAAIRNRKDER